jgi:hypothetical protein
MDVLLERGARRPPARRGTAGWERRARASVSTLDFKEPLQFWDLLSAVINENPPQDEIT